MLSKRFAHTDVRFPNLDHYRLDATKSPNKSSSDSEDDRRGLYGVVTYGGK